MAHFTVTRDVIRRISEIETPHACALNEDISDEFPQRRMRGLHARRGVQRCHLAGFVQRCCRAGARGRWPQCHGASHGLRADTGDLKSAGTAAMAGAMIGAAQFQNVRSAPVATAAATFRAATARHAQRPCTPWRAGGPPRHPRAPAWRVPRGRGNVDAAPRRRPCRSIGRVMG